MTPKSVILAVLCFGISLVIGVAILLYAWREPMLALLCLLFVGLLIALTAQRHNWARWTLTVVTLASLIVNWVLGFLPFQLTYGGLISAGTVMQVGLELAGCVLLYVAASRQWYALPAEKR